VPFDQLLGRQPATSSQGPKFGDFHAVARHVVRLARLHRVHDGRGVIAELSLADDLHTASVVQRSPPGYTRWTCSPLARFTLSGGAGRTTSTDNFASLINDVEDRLFAVLPDDTWFYPGHGDDSTLGKERPSLAEWRAHGW